MYLNMLYVCMHALLIPNSIYVYYQIIEYISTPAQLHTHACSLLAVQLCTLTFYHVECESTVTVDLFTCKYLLCNVHNFDKWPHLL